MENDVITMELHQKTKRLTELREGISEIYDEIRGKCSPLRVACILSHYKSDISIRLDDGAHKSLTLP